ncbi:MAG: LytR C-terminal domain-containing protein [Bacteroidetes Order II. Incertae sedis bacterium]|nr:LytR C-terminal domain-containing protein [Bacteroidetes Order II. bacterium]MBT4603151.1 LytR C-terminal domain-containing protein [Bacteroidetes Order II. bacterium]MBT5250649.1 LytR C-terminal domain-containing protein [Bacteroidetes Order II. bacterium]MBT6199053.1 LytR C-terminal domain-containing protein [Bacteroidetes Order II. bacterium]MBT6425742.1 LytR C-terminal domain-containing protein [Bacteroidetes Order II. bacterium]
MAGKFGNWMMNVGIAVAVLVAAVLLYAFYVRISTPIPDPMRLDGETDLLGSTIQVQVLNGAGVDNLGLQMENHLISLGFDVVETDNFRKGMEKTVILDRLGNLDASEQVALAIEANSERISTDILVDYYLDATIIIGRDYQEFLPWKVPDLEEVN